MTTQRITNDQYFTASEVTRLLTEKVDIKGIVFEPCAGNGDIAAQFSGRCFTNDIDSNLRKQDGSEHDYNSDATDSLVWQQWSKYNRIDWVVTNPPYNKAFDVLQHSWNNCTTGVAMLLRLSFLEPTKQRGQWLEENADQMCKIIPVNPRIRFRQDTNGSDSVTVAWFVWRKDFSWDNYGCGCPFDFIREWR